MTSQLSHVSVLCIILYTALLFFEELESIIVQNSIYRMSQELRSLLQDLIPELMLSQKLHIHVGPVRDGS